MSNVVLATVVFAVSIVGLALFLILAGKLSFWKLASKLPEQTIKFMESDPAWVFAHESDKPPGFTGPFYLQVPSIGQTIKIYGDPEKIEESQAKFIKFNQDLIPKQGFPYISFLALIYPVAAMFSMSGTTAPIMAILGYGFANLGYLLLAAGVFGGQFRAFSLVGRIPTILAAVITWVIGVALSNVA